ncbi:hypothetical protein [Pseudomonas sp. R5(2019)]|uniref:hypothetical protein n=1 Tax=Pseudomonas sp. R5(2019) TaxID=2697566 RepID=UPI001412B5C1|nr:hypothetical protein [Pseudomonas sp. R5(2019)]NBA96839.1 hypothetical protein [Pseudomonas sp. R5(2019)]
MATQTKTNVKQKTCQNPDCKKRFRPARSTAKFCSTECKERKNTISKRKPFTIPRSNHFFLYLAKEAQRAGTLAIFGTLVGSVDNLIELYSVVKLRMTANVLSGKDSFHICHVAPVKHENVLGLSNAENLIIAPSFLNRRHSNTHSNKAGVFMYRANVELKHYVGSDEAGVLDRIINMIGEETIIAFCKKAKLTESRRQASLAKLAKLVDYNNPEHARFIAILEDSSSKTPEIVAAVEAVQNRAEFKPMMKGCRLSDSAMLIKELIRHAEFRYELEEFADIAKQYTRGDFAHIGLSIDAQRTLFDLLHGVVAEEMEDEVDCFKYELRAPLRAAEQRHSEVLILNQERLTARAQAAVQDVVSEAEQAAKRIRDMVSNATFYADFLDGADFCYLPTPAVAIVPTPAPLVVYGPDEIAF